MLEVLRLNIWYLSLRQAQKYSLDDDTVGSMSPYIQSCSCDLYGIYPFAFREGHSSPYLSYTERSRNVATKTTTSRNAFVGHRNLCLLSIMIADTRNVFSLFFNFLVSGLYVILHGLPRREALEVKSLNHLKDK